MLGSEIEIYNSKGFQNDIGSIPLGLDLHSLISYNRSNEFNLTKEVYEIRKA